MSKTKRLTVRSCPVCRVAMVHDAYGWNCPQCGSAIIDPSKGEAGGRERAPTPSARAEDGALRG